MLLTPNGTLNRMVDDRYFASSAYGHRDRDGGPANRPAGWWNPVEEEWTIQVPSRSGSTAQVDLPDLLRRAQGCPFCPPAPEVPVAGYDVLLIPSKYPLVESLPDGDGLISGCHDVFLYTDDHAGRLVDQSRDRVAGLLAALAARTEQMLADPLVRAVFGFECQGDHFGPTVAHPHGQLIGFPFVPRRLSVAGPDCLMCTIRHEAPHLVVHGGQSSVVAVPPYARFPFEMVVAPTRHVPTLSQLAEAELTELAGSVLAALRACLDDEAAMPQHLLTVMQAAKGHQERHHLRFELLPLHRPGGGIKRPGGVEIGAGVYLNSLPPSQAATLLRERLRERSPREFRSSAPSGPVPTCSG
ncbi:UDPglucose--hexose-1-phosphate uridylyltransferase [Micromonospora sp. Llam0]|nr:UDPglucose--hexose-1-phosphate uridylyltransferase [Micromonospora sp. Llam0]